MSSLCTPCHNYERNENIPPLRYEPSLDIGESCGRCGDSALDERIYMGLAEDDSAIVECRMCEEMYWDDEIGEHHFLEHPRERFDPVWYYE